MKYLKEFFHIFAIVLAFSFVGLGALLAIAGLSWLYTYTSEYLSAPIAGAITLVGFSALISVAFMAVDRVP